MTEPETDMSTAPESPMPRSLEDIQDAIVEQLHAGEPVDRQAILENHSEHTTALEQFFAVVDMMEAGPTPELPAPTRLGEFRIVREVGRGGMGVVYEAEQPSLRRQVALKVLPPALQNDRRLLQRFRREAEAAGRLRHRNIVPVFSFGEAGGAPFFAMELVNGPSLAEVLRRRRIEDDAGLPTDPDEYRAWAVETVAQIADALAYAHRQGVLHRDVKPANILLDESGAPRLTDFGLALDLEATSLSVSGEIFGSPRYMSPEQAFRRQTPIDARTDVYSLAVTLYELLTLRLPYDGVTGSEILMALEKGRIHPLRQDDPGASSALEAVVTKALQLDPERRYPSADEFAEDLRAALAGNGVAAPRYRLRRRLTMVAAAVVLVLAGAAAYDEWARPVLWENPLAVPDIAPGAGPWVRMPSASAIRSLADGTHPDGAAALKTWFTSSLEHRSILSRNDPAFAQGALAFPLSASWQDHEGDAIVAVGTLEFSIDGGPWGQSPGQPSIQIPIAGGGGLSTYFSRYRLHDALSEALQRDSFSLAHRLSLRILRTPPGLEILPFDKSAHDYESGTLAIWRFEPRVIFVYDDYPADYPERVSNPELDADMQLTYTPTGVGYVRTGLGGPSGKSLALTLYFSFVPGRRLVPIASSVELYAPGQDTLMATGVYATKGIIDGKKSHSTGSHFYLPETPTPEQQAFLLDLTTGRLDSVRLVFRPSRKTALEEPSFDSYWGGTLDVTVPLTKKKSLHVLVEGAQLH